MCTQSIERMKMCRWEQKRSNLIFYQNLYLSYLCMCVVGASVWMLNGWIIWTQAGWEERKFCWCYFLCADIIKWQQWKRFYKELLSFYIAMVVATWRFINFYPSFHDDDNDDDDLLSLSITQAQRLFSEQHKRCERCGTNDDGNFFKLYKARHTILHCICHAETLTSDARYICGKLKTCDRNSFSKLNV